MAKEGSFSSRTDWIVKHNILPMGRGLAQVNYEGWGVCQSDTGEGLLHNASAHVVGGLLVVKGVYKNDSGLISYTRPDGDQIFMTYICSAVVGKNAKGTFTYVGGTGKFVGIQGSCEFTRHMLQNPTKEFGASFASGKGHWKIVAPQK
ncbi:MAG: hypothetical protein WAL98_08665 [Desulfatiglandaceae bacterium]